MVFTSTTRVRSDSLVNRSVSWSSGTTPFVPVWMTTTGARRSACSRARIREATAPNWRATAASTVTLGSTRSTA